VVPLRAEGDFFFRANREGLVQFKNTRWIG
jgi:hypothetical protein